MGVCNCSMFCCTLLYVHSSFAIILTGKRELVALLSLSSWCLVIVGWLFLMVPWVCLQFVIVVFLDLTHYFSCCRSWAVLDLYSFLAAIIHYSASLSKLPLVHKPIPQHSFNPPPPPPPLKASMTSYSKCIHMLNTV